MATKANPPEGTEIYLQVYRDSIKKHRAQIRLVQDAMMLDRTKRDLIESHREEINLLLKEIEVIKREEIIAQACENLINGNIADAKQLIAQIKRPKVTYNEIAKVARRYFKGGAIAATLYLIHPSKETWNNYCAQTSS